MTAPDADADRGGPDARPRSWVERLLAAGAAAAIAFLALYFPDGDDPSGATLGAAFAFVAVVVGMAALARVRPLPRRSAGERARLAGLALVVGAAVGIGNLLANYGIALSDPRIHGQMVEQWSRFSPWSMIVSEVLMEELVFRLVGMGGVAWVVSRFVDDRRVVFLVAWIVPALLFGIAHVVYPNRPPVDALHAFAVTIKSGAAALLLGWVFWRWGLPYSIACHSVANATHLLAAPLLF